MRTTTSTRIARSLRQNQTDAERRLWRHLRNYRFFGHKFRRQHPIPPYVVDFICIARGLIVELDGGQHAERRAADEQRTAFLAQRGYRVIRFWNDEVLNRTEAVLEVIRVELERLEPPSPLPGAPSPLPQGGEGVKVCAPSPQPSPPRGRGSSSADSCG